MDCGVKLARFLLIIFNIIFWLSGVALLAVGIWISVVKSLSELIEFVAIDESDPLFKYAAYVLIGVGAFIFVVGFVGCFGALKNSRFLLGLYIFFLLLVLIGELAAGIMVFVYKRKIDNEFEEQWSDKLMEDTYANMTWEPIEYTAFGLSMNLVQWKFDCCGVNGIDDYMLNNTHWPKMDKDGGDIPFPFTCCVLKDKVDDPRKVNKTMVKDIDKCYMQENDFIWTNGCRQGLLDWFADHALILGGVGIGIAFLEIFGICFACCLCRAVKKEEDDYS